MPQLQRYFSDPHWHASFFFLRKRNARSYLPRTRRHKLKCLLGARSLSASGCGIPEGGLGKGILRVLLVCLKGVPRVPSPTCPRARAHTDWRQRGLQTSRGRGTFELQEWLLRHPGSTFFFFYFWGHIWLCSGNALDFLLSVDSWQYSKYLLCC